MGNSSKSTERGVTRTLPTDMPAAVTPVVMGTGITAREDGCPSEATVDVLIPTNEAPPASARPRLRMDSVSGVRIAWNGFAVRISNDLGAELRACIDKGRRYRVEVKDRTAIAEGIRATLHLTAVRRR